MPRPLKEWLRFCWWLAVLSPMDLLVRLVRCKPDARKVLVIRLDAIGDFVLWLDAARALRTLFPEGEYRLTLLGNEVWTPLAERLGCFDEVWSLNLRRFVVRPSYRFRLMAGARRAGFGTVIHPTYSRELLCGDATVRITGARERIGSRGDLARTNAFLKRISDRWYTRLLPADPRPLPEIERNAEFVRGLGVTTFPTRLPTLFVPNEANVVQESREYYVVCPGAAYEYRQWPVERFAEIAARIYNRTGWAGLVCGGMAERSLSQRLIDIAGVPLKNRAGRTSLVELALLIKSARLVITNETAAVHIAAAVGTRTICVLGGGHFGRFLPYHNLDHAGRPLPIAVSVSMDCFGCNWRCIYNVGPGAPKPCVSHVTVEAVWDSVRSVLNGLAAGTRSP